MCSDNGVYVDQWQTLSRHWLKISMPVTISVVPFNVFGKVMKQLKTCKFYHSRSYRGLWEGCRASGEHDLLPDFLEPECQPDHKPHTHLGHRRCDDGITNTRQKN
jgi:hypothetical protein